MPFPFIFYNFVEIYKGVTMKKKVLENDEFLLKFDEKSLESLME